MAVAAWNLEEDEEPLKVAGRETYPCVLVARFSVAGPPMGPRSPTYSTSKH